MRKINYTCNCPRVTIMLTSLTPSLSGLPINPAENSRMMAAANAYYCEREAESLNVSEKNPKTLFKTVVQSLGVNVLDEQACSVGIKTPSLIFQYLSAWTGLRNEKNSVRSVFEGCEPIWSCGNSADILRFAVISLHYRLIFVHSDAIPPKSVKPFSPSDYSSSSKREEKSPFFFLFRDGQPDGCLYASVLECEAAALSQSTLPEDVCAAYEGVMPGFSGMDNSVRRSCGGTLSLTSSRFTKAADWLRPLLCYVYTTGHHVDRSAIFKGVLEIANIVSTPATCNVNERLGFLRAITKTKLTGDLAKICHFWPRVIDIVRPSRYKIIKSFMRSGRHTMYRYAKINCPYEAPVILQVRGTVIHPWRIWGEGVFKARCLEKNVLIKLDEFGAAYGGEILLGVGEVPYQSLKGTAVFIADFNQWFKVSPTAPCSYQTEGWKLVVVGEIGEDGFIRKHKSCLVSGTDLRNNWSRKVRLRFPIQENIPLLCVFNGPNKLVPLFGVFFMADDNEEK